MTKKHFVYIPFTGVGLIGYKGDDWLKERITIFKKYTLKSLLNQIDKDFILWLSFRPEEGGNPHIDNLENYLTHRNIKYVITYHGLMYHDDKFTTGIKNRVLNIARVIRRCLRDGQWKELVPSIKDLFIDKNSTLEDRLRRSLKELPKMDKVGWVYLTRIDSDDMFNKKTIGRIKQTVPHKKLAIICKKGLLLNSTTGELAEWNPDTNPPFHTIVFPSYVFYNPKRHLEYYGQFTSHEDIPKVFETKELPDYSYCVTVHSPKNHISTIWNHPFRGIMMNKDRLKDFI